MRQQLKRMKSKAISEAATAIVVLIIAVAVVTAVYVDNSQGSSDQISSLQSVIQSLTRSGTVSNAGGLPVMNQPPAIRTVTETWYLSSSSHQDRFDPDFIVVNQGDTVRLTFIDNDSVAHNFVIGPPYNILVNATVPGLINDLTHQEFSTNATNNSPGVVVKGTPGNVTASYSFMAAYAGVYEFVCTYHVEVGMFGYLVVLPNAGYHPGSTTQTTRSTTVAGTVSNVAIAQGSGADVNNKGFTPNTITVKIGVNSTVLWTNNDVAPHTVTANDGSFESPTLNQGDTFMVTFTTPGVYEYHCVIHPWMTGKVIVVA